MMAASTAGAGDSPARRPASLATLLNGEAGFSHPVKEKEPEHTVQNTWDSDLQP